MWPALSNLPAARYRGIDDYTFQLLEGTSVPPHDYQTVEFARVVNGGASDNIVEVDDTYYWLSRQTGEASAVWIPKPTRHRSRVLVLLDGFREGPCILRHANMAVDKVEIRADLSYVYPRGWARSTRWSNEKPMHANDLFAFGRNSASSAAQSSNCIVCGSRGGQATLILSLIHI